MAGTLTSSSDGRLPPDPGRQTVLSYRPDLPIPAMCQAAWAYLGALAFALTFTCNRLAEIIGVAPESWEC